MTIQVSPQESQGSHFEAKTRKDAKKGRKRGGKKELSIGKKGEWKRTV